MRIKVWGYRFYERYSLLEFCRKHHIIGVPGRNLDPSSLRPENRPRLRESLEALRFSHGVNIGSVVRFCQLCKEDDFAIVRDPWTNLIVFTRIVSPLLHRNFATEEIADLWLYRKVETLSGPILLEILPRRISTLFINTSDTFFPVSRFGKSMLAYLQARHELEQYTTDVMNDLADKPYADESERRNSVIARYKKLHKEKYER
jgi:hypothetical protein